MSSNQEQGQAIAVDSRFFGLIDAAAAVCNRQWPDSDNPAATLRMCAGALRNQQADLARVTAERDEYKKLMESAQTRCEVVKEKAEEAERQRDALVEGVQELIEGLDENAAEYDEIDADSEVAGVLSSTSSDLTALLARVEGEQG